MRYHGTQLVAQKRFRRLKTLFFIYALAWVGVLIFVNLYWDIGAIWRLVITVALAIVGPSVQDLVEPYSTYKRDWQADNADTPPQDANDGSPVKPA
jgi:hypothetical protein